MDHIIWGTSSLSPRLFDVGLAWVLADPVTDLILAGWGGPDGVSQMAAGQNPGTHLKNQKKRTLA